MYVEVWNITVYNQNVPDRNKHWHQQPPDVVKERPCCLSDSEQVHDLPLKLPHVRQRIRIRFFCFVVVMPPHSSPSTYIRNAYKWCAEVCLFVCFSGDARKHLARIERHSCIDTWNMFGTVWEIPSMRRSERNPNVKGKHSFVPRIQKRVTFWDILWHFKMSQCLTFEFCDNFRFLSHVTNFSQFF